MEADYKVPSLTSGQANRKKCQDLITISATSRTRLTIAKVIDGGKDRWNIFPPVGTRHPWLQQISEKSKRQKRKQLLNLNLTEESNEMKDLVFLHPKLTEKCSEFLLKFAPFPPEISSYAFVMLHKY